MNKIKFILAALLISLLVILAKNEYSSLLLNNASYGIPALTKYNDIDNLFIGSSMFRQGLDIRVLNNYSDSVNYVLSYNGNQPALEYYQLQKIISSGVSIKNLYIDLYAYSAAEAPALDDEKLLLEYNLKDKWNLWRLLSENNKADFDTFWKMFVTSNNELLLSWFLNYPIINSQFLNGGSLIPSASASSDHLTGSSFPTITKGINPIQKDYIAKIISLTKENNINLVFVETPKYATVANDASYLNIMEEYISLLNEENIPTVIHNTTYEYLRRKSYASTPTLNTYYLFDNTASVNYSDLIHLSKEGKHKFTESFLSVTQTK